MRKTTQSLKGLHGMIGDRMQRSDCEISREILLELDSVTLRNQQEVRAPIVAMKPVKAEGAKGGRKANPRKPNVT